MAAAVDLAQAGAKSEEVERAKTASDALASFVFPGKAYSPEPGGFMSGDLLQRNPLADFYAFTGLLFFERLSLCMRWLKVAKVTFTTTFVVGGMLTLLRWLLLLEKICETTTHLGPQRTSFGTMVRWG